MLNGALVVSGLVLVAAAGLVSLFQGAKVPVLLVGVVPGAELAGRVHSVARLVPVELQAQGSLAQARHKVQFAGSRSGCSTVVGAASAPTAGAAAPATSSASASSASGVAAEVLGV